MMLVSKNLSKKWNLTLSRKSRFVLTLSGVVVAFVLAGCQSTRQPVAGQPSPSQALPQSSSVLAMAGGGQNLPIVDAHRLSTKNMNLVDSVGIAIARHPDIGRGRAVVVESQTQIAIEKSVWFPTVQYGVSPGYSRYYGASDRGNQSTVQASVGANQLVYDFGRTSSRIAAARASHEKEQFVLADVVENVAATTASTFVELAAAQSLIAAADREYKAMMLTRDRIAERVSTGLSDAVDLNQADLAIQRARSDLLSAQTRYDVAVGRFTELVGVRPDKVVDLDTTAAFVEQLGASGGNKSIDKTPVVLAAEAEVKAAEQRVRAARAQLYPSVSVSVSQQKASGGRNVSNDSSFVGLQLSGDLNTGFRERHMVTAAQAQLEAARLSSEHERLVARTALGSAETEAAGARARMDNSRQLVSLSLTSRDLYWQQYTLNRRPLTDVVNAERDTFMAESDYINAMADRINAQIRAYYAMGELVKRLSERQK